MRTGIATLPLHNGKAPRWLFERMVRLAREIVCAVVQEYGAEEFLARLADPYWFQAFGCVLGFDWHSSGLTTTTCGALKLSVAGIEEELGIFVCGGKGGASRKTPHELAAWADRLALDPSSLIYASKMSAKVDNAAIQDGYQLYHHTFVFTRKGSWGVVQQGMSEQTHYARRYHWLSSAMESFVLEPQAAICCDATGQTLNMVAVKSEVARQVTTELASHRPEETLRTLRQLSLPTHHHVANEQLIERQLRRSLAKAYESHPKDFEALLAVDGVGPKTIRALALISELVHGAPPSFEDPARYSFAHGGKDGHPYPVDRATYERSIQLLHKAIEQAKVGRTERVAAFGRLATWLS